jgi:hypothetical protein
MSEDLQVRVTGEEEFGKFKTVEALIKRTNIEHPAQADRDELRRLLQENPRMWKWAGDVSRRATDHVIKTYSGKPALSEESQQRAVELMREEYGHKDAPPLERMLIEQIIICWLCLNSLTVAHTSKTYESHNTETGLYWDRRLTNAQRRFTRAVESLAKVRALTAAARMAESRIERQAGNVRQLKAVG